MPGVLVDVVLESSEMAGIYFFNSNKYISVSNKDGVHLTREGNVLLGKELGKYIKKVFGKNKQPLAGFEKRSS